MTDTATSDTATSDTSELESGTKPATTARKPTVGSDPTKGNLVKLWQNGIYAFAIGTTVILVGAILASIARGNFPRLLLAMAVFIIGLSWSVLRTKNANFIEPGGISVGSAEPALRDFVHEIAAELGTEPPSEINLIVEAEIDLREGTRHFGRTLDRSVLVIGLPFVRTMTRRELAALLAHQLGHVTEHDVHEGPRALRSLREARKLIAGERSGFVSAVYGSYARKMYRSVGGVAVAQEEVSDRLAAELYGTDTLITALDKVDETVIGFEQLLRHYFVPAMQAGVHPEDVYGGLSQLMDAPGRDSERERGVARRREAVRDDFTLHLTAIERIEEIKSWPTTAGTVEMADGDLPAHTLLDPAAKSEEIAVGMWASGLIDQRTHPQSWDELTAEVYGPNLYALAPAPFEGSTPAQQFEQALTWCEAGDWTEVDEAIEHGRKKRQPIEDRRSDWAQAVVLEAAAATDRYEWQASWDHDPQLVDADGTVFDPAPIAALLMAGDAAGARLAFDQI